MLRSFIENQKTGKIFFQETFFQLWQLRCLVRISKALSLSSLFRSGTDTDFWHTTVSDNPALKFRALIIDGQHVRKTTQTYFQNFESSAISHRIILLRQSLNLAVEILDHWEDGCRTITDGCNHVTGWWFSSSIHPLCCLRKLLSKTFLKFDQTRQLSVWGVVSGHARFNQVQTCQLFRNMLQLYLFWGKISILN